MLRRSLIILFGVVLLVGSGCCDSDRRCFRDPTYCCPPCLRQVRGPFFGHKPTRWREWSPEWRAYRAPELMVVEEVVENVVEEPAVMSVLDSVDADDAARPESDVDEQVEDSDGALDDSLEDDDASSEDGELFDDSEEEGKFDDDDLGDNFPQIDYPSRAESLRIMPPEPTSTEPRGLGPFDRPLALVPITSHTKANLNSVLPQTRDDEVIPVEYLAPFPPLSSGETED